MPKKTASLLVTMLMCLSIPALAEEATGQDENSAVVPETAPAEETAAPAEEIPTPEATPEAIVTGPEKPAAAPAEKITVTTTVETDEPAVKPVAPAKPAVQAKPTAAEKRWIDKRQDWKKEQGMKRQRRQMVGLGPSLTIPSWKAYGQPLVAGIQTNLSFLEADYYLKHGGSVLLNPRIRIRSSVELHLFSFGVLFYHGNPFTVPSIQRWWDIQMRPIQLDVRLARYGEISISANWFIPNPIAIKDAAENLVMNCTDSAIDTANNTIDNEEADETGGQETAVACQNVKSQGLEMLYSLRDATQSIFITVSVRGIVDGKYGKRWKMGD